jgi:hypothetical protein
MASLEDVMDEHNADSVVRAVFEMFAAGDEDSALGLMETLDDGQLLDITTIVDEAAERRFAPLAGLAVGKLTHRDGPE